MVTIKRRGHCSLQSALLSLFLTHLSLFLPFSNERVSAIASMEERAGAGRGRRLFPCFDHRLSSQSVACHRFNGQLVGRFSFVRSFTFQLSVLLVLSSFFFFSTTWIYFPSHTFTDSNTVSENLPVTFCVLCHRTSTLFCTTLLFFDLLLLWLLLQFSYRVAVLCFTKCRPLLLSELLLSPPRLQSLWELCLCCTFWWWSLLVSSCPYYP